MRLSESAFFVLVVLAPFAPAASAQTGDDTLVYAIQSDMQNWDPPNSVLRESIILGYHVFDHLATSWKALDETSWEVKLRRDVRFHTGDRFTARDVKATFDRVLDEKNKLTARGN